MDGFQVVIEALQTKMVDFVVHAHEPRRGSTHYDLRFLSPKDPNVLHSFALPSNFLDTVDNKTTVVRTKEHDPRWLSLKSYRLKVIDSGHAVVKVATNKYFELVFKGKVLNGFYKLFKLSKARRNDYWMLIKK
jgi:hypothetical protein